MNGPSDDDRNRRNGSANAAGPHENRREARPGEREPAARDGGAAKQDGAKSHALLPALALPKGGGAVRGIGEKLGVAAATGTASLAIPLPISPGRGGFGPDLALAYDSGAGNGPFGMGFHLSVPAITRKTDKGLPRYDDAGESDVYIVAGAEDLVPVPTPPDAGDAAHAVQRYRPRVEGAFARIERWTRQSDGDVHWRVTTADNVTHFYGRQPSEVDLPTLTAALPRIADPRDARRVFSWLLEESRDDRGNIVRYEYKAEDGVGVDPARLRERSRFEGEGAARAFVATAQRYLKRVRYGNMQPGVPGDFLFELVFDYGEHAELPVPEETPGGPAWGVRADAFSSYRSCFEVRTYRLCRRVLMFHRLSADRRALLVRATELTHDTGTFPYLLAIRQLGYRFDDPASTTPDVGELPTLLLDYTRPVIHDELAALPPESLAGLEGGVDGARKQWVDLDGEGIPGVLIDADTAWYYKANAGGGRLAPPRLLPTMPAPASLAGGVQQLQDLGGDGRLDLVAYQPSLPGFFSRTAEGGFSPLQAFRTLPNIDFHDPNLRFVDLDGDGLGDILVTDDHALVWYRSLGKQGFEPYRRIPIPSDDARGPAVVFSDPLQTVQLADMSGDGLVDIVRVRNGEVAYWPNLGYGRFGAKITLEGSPAFASPDEFDARRVRFGDVDGSGTSDIFYLGRDGVTLYLNEFGNRLAAPVPIRSLPRADSVTQLGVIDLLGHGMTSLVWSSPLPAAEGRPILYVDLMAGRKPHLLEKVVNNLGAETTITYAPSTKFYLEDKAAGTPWITRLAFPVHVVERVEHVDDISKGRLVTSYRYRHGFFDGVEREFRGFARVEQLDAEEFTVGDAGTAEFQAPVRTVSWFHTGAWFEKERLEVELAREYFQASPAPLLLPDTIRPADLSADDDREATRALKGRMLRQEIYAEDAGDPAVGAERAARPFVTTEQSFAVRLLQSSAAPRAQHGVFLVQPSETVTLHSERDPGDPRVTHELVLEVDDFGNVRRKVDVAYARANPARQEQGRAWATLTEVDFAHAPDQPGFYRVSIPFGGRAFELTGLPLPLGGQGLIARAELLAIVDGLDHRLDVPYDQHPTGNGVERRLLDSKQQIYYDDAAIADLPLGQFGTRALPFERYQLALTPGLVGELVDGSTALTGVAFSTAVLATEGRYVTRPGSDGTWAPSGRLVYDTGRFFLPVEAIDPFGGRHFVRYDGFALLVEATQDPLGNVARAVNDYRVLAPSEVTDPNLNRVAVAFDALGMVTATAVMGKATASPPEGDTIDEPTVRIEYQLLRWQNPDPLLGPLPAMVHTTAREVHGPTNTRSLENFAYSDGFGRVVMQKVRAEPGPLFDASGKQLPGPPPARRWVGTGRTVFNNKGNPVKQYEPFFSAMSEFEDEAAVVQAGVTPVIHYDPLGRAVRTELPNGTLSRVVFDAWSQETWDPNDTVLESRWYRERGSPDPAAPAPLGDAEARAAWLAARHAETPSVAHLDTLGRPFVVVEHNRTWSGDDPPADDFLETKTALDIEGNALTVTDARGIETLTQRFDVLGRTQRTDSRDAGTRLVAADAAGKPLRRWDSRGQITRLAYDALQRPTQLFVKKTGGDREGQSFDPNERLLVLSVYGENLDDPPPRDPTPPGPAPDQPPAPSAAQALNLRGQVFRVYDCAGAVSNDRFDFKGNLEISTRRLAASYTVEPAWNDLDGIRDPAAIQQRADALLERPSTAPLTTFTLKMTYDALNRPTSRTTPDQSVTVPAYNEAGLLEQVRVGVHGPDVRVLVKNIDYNARGQRVRYDYANPDPVTGGGGATTCTTVYSYDPFTFRLTSLATTRASDGTGLQSLAYTHDPVGNIVQLDDASLLPSPTPPSASLYVYDAVYRLTRATGREHPGQVGGQLGFGDADPAGIPHANDLQALVSYNETYAYDRGGNIERLQHIADAGNSGWTRRYTYATDRNRLLATSGRGSDPDDTYGPYTEHGSMQHMTHLPAIDWDYADRLQHTSRGDNDDVFFTYDGGGQRVRKVHQHRNSNDGLDHFDERIYVGGWETFRSRTGTFDSAPTLERETLHVMDDTHRVAMVETKITDTDRGPSGPQWRVQLDNHLGSAILELAADGAIITYEEYHPYGTTAFRAADGNAEVSAKRYRYTGKEKDEETGLYYHGARYYAPWLGRWTAADPAGMVDGPNLYAYSRNGPVQIADPSGTRGTTADDEPSARGRMNLPPSPPPRKERQLHDLATEADWRNVSDAPTDLRREITAKMAGAEYGVVQNNLVFNDASGFRYLPYAEIPRGASQYGKYIFFKDRKGLEAIPLLSENPDDYRANGPVSKGPGLDPEGAAYAAGVSNAIVKQSLLEGKDLHGAVAEATRQTWELTKLNFAYAAMVFAGAAAGVALGATGADAEGGSLGGKGRAPSARATAPVEKFSKYIFREGATHGKAVPFRNLGYGRPDSARLAGIYGKQAAEKFLKGEYAFAKRDQYGQRVDIEIELPGVRGATGQTSYLRSGWMIRPDGSITLNTPFAGFTRGR